MNIMQAVENDGLPLKKVSAVELSSPCPLCGGEDRFRVWPDESRWFCRGCDKSGDVIEYFKHVHGKTFQEAAALAGKTLEKSFNAKPQLVRKEWAPKPSELPPDLWRQKANIFVDYCHAALLRNPEMMEWLKTERGIDSDTVRSARLGWHPTDLFRDLGAWGLPEKLNENGNPSKLFLPAGLTIPAFSASGELVRVRVRRHNPKEDEARYVVVPGSSMVPMVCGNSGPVVILESELDALLLSSTVPGTMAVALGSVSTRPDIDLANRLRSCSEVLIALDLDEAGGKQSWGFWKKNFPQAKRWPVPTGKDPAGYRLEGGDLSVWIAAANHDRTQPEWFALFSRIAVIYDLLPENDPARTVFLKSDDFDELAALAERIEARTRAA